VEVWNPKEAQEVTFSYGSVVTLPFQATAAAERGARSPTLPVESLSVIDLVIAVNSTRGKIESSSV
jgi:hypothetical protein